MEYNTSRNKLIIAEYGRNVQRMAEFACEIEDREERNKAANSIINLMSIMNPHFREEEDYKHKLWDHLHIISHFELDVDSPYPVPEPEKKPEPKKLSYPKRKMKYAHYGNIIEGFINHAITLPEGEEREKLIELSANMMKRAYLNWNRDSVNDEMIKEQLSKLSGDILKVKESVRLTSTNEILYSPNKQSKTPPTGQQNNNQNKNRHNKNRSNQNRNPAFNQKNNNNNFKKKF